MLFLFGFSLLLVVMRVCEEVTRFDLEKEVDVYIAMWLIAAELTCLSLTLSKFHGSTSLILEYFENII